MALSDGLVGRAGVPRYSASQREVVFRLLDRGGTIRAAAVGAGVSADTGYRWRRQAGVASRRQRPRVYTAQEKAEFFRLLSIRGNVSAVARELGYVRVTCYKWAHQAGIFTGKDVSDQRQEFLQLRSEGVSRRQAAEQVGVDKRTAQDWDKGIRQFYGGRVYPDGRVVKYRPAEILANVKNPRNTDSHNDNRGTLERLERSISPRFLSLTEREQIHDLKATGLSIRQIGHQLSRAPSTISRELRRNATQSLVVCPSNNWQWVGMISGVGKPVPALSVTDAQREVLESLARSQSGPHREVVRAKALLMAADGASNATIAARLSVSRSTVANWRTRFTEDGLVKFGQVREGRGRKSSIPDATIEKIVTLTKEYRPEGETHWSTRTMAGVAGVSKSTVQRVWKELGLKPHRVDTFKVSGDPKFEEKLVDVVGLYLNPRAPRGADDLSGGERPSPPDLSQQGR